MMTQTPSLDPEQLRAARAFLGWGRTQCGKIAGVSAETIRNIEKYRFLPNAASVEKLVSTFAQHGVIFLAFDPYRGVLFNGAFAKTPETKQPDNREEPTKNKEELTDKEF
jgi:DNA-binding XRE family transcriptional regulator